jgi:hypothetical protein
MVELLIDQNEEEERDVSQSQSRMDEGESEK